MNKAAQNPQLSATISPHRPARFRWQAFAIHLGISLTILAVLLYLLFYHWFPDYLFDTDGGWQALRVIAGVDIILGPVLTLIAANPAKTTRELRRDFTAIGLIQALALSAGVWLAWDNRPYAVFWFDGSFQSQPWSSFHDEKAARAWIKNQHETTPIMVYVDLPDDIFRRSELFRKALSEKTSAMFSAPLFRAWPGDPAHITAYAGSYRKWLAADAQREKTYRARLAELHLDDATTLPVATRSRYSTYFLLLSAATLRPVGIVTIAPPSEMLAGLMPNPHRNTEDESIAPQRLPKTQP